MVSCGPVWILDPRDKRKGRFDDTNVDDSDDSNVSPQRQQVLLGNGGRKHRQRRSLGIFKTFYRWMAKNAL